MKTANKFALSTALAFLAIAPSGVLAQDKSETLADIRADLTFLYSQIQTLRQELVKTGNENQPALTGPALLRVDQLETDLRRLTGKVEELEFRIDNIVRDGTNRVGDLEFRLVELEGGDVSKLGKTPTLGGAKPTPSNNSNDDMQLAVAEREEFDAALALLKSGNAGAAETQFAIFLQNYPGTPLTGAAQYWQGVALAQQENWGDSARAHLASLKSTPDGDYADNAMMGLGVGLVKLGKNEQGCKTLRAVSQRYPGSDALDETKDMIAQLGCS